MHTPSFCFHWVALIAKNANENNYLQESWQKPNGPKELAGRRPEVTNACLQKLRLLQRRRFLFRVRCGRETKEDTTRRRRSTTLRGRTPCQMMQRKKLMSTLREPITFEGDAVEVYVIEPDQLRDLAARFGDATADRLIEAIRSTVSSRRQSKHLSCGCCAQSIEWRRSSICIVLPPRTKSFISGDDSIAFYDFLNFELCPRCAATPVEDIADGVKLAARWKHRDLRIVSFAKDDFGDERPLPMLACDDPRRLHSDCLAYDHGQRVALREQLSVLIELAAAQAGRSLETSKHVMAGDYERALHDQDLQFWRSLARVFHGIVPEPARPRGAQKKPRVAVASVAGQSQESWWAF